MNSNQELMPSPLGTKNFWKETYQQELDNFNEHSDYGEIWFGKGSISRITNWMTSSELVTKADSILEVGCGNGTLLLQLEKEGYINLTGVDYVEEAIQLAKLIAQKENAKIVYEVGDIASNDFNLLKGQKYNVVLDKGTYDALSLDPVDSQLKRNTYAKNVNILLEMGGLLIITSCNWTTEELKLHFQEKMGFKYLHHIPFPTFQFGGKTGNTVSSLVFQKSIESAILK